MQNQIPHASLFPIPSKELEIVIDIALLDRNDLGRMVGLSQDLDRIQRVDFSKRPQYTTALRITARPSISIDGIQYAFQYGSMHDGSFKAEGSPVLYERGNLPF